MTDSTHGDNEDLDYSHEARLELICALANWGCIKEADRAPIRAEIEEVVTYEEVLESTMKAFGLCGFDIVDYASADDEADLVAGIEEYLKGKAT